MTDRKKEGLSEREGIVAHCPSNSTFTQTGNR